MTSTAGNENSERTSIIYRGTPKGSSNKQAVLWVVCRRDCKSTPSGTISPDPSHPSPSGMMPAEVHTQDLCHERSGSWPVPPPPWWFLPFFPLPSAWHDAPPLLVRLDGRWRRLPLPPVPRFLLVVVGNVLSSLLTVTKILKHLQMPRQTKKMWLKRIPLHTSLTLRPSKWWGSTH